MLSILTFIKLSIIRILIVFFLILLLMCFLFGLLLVTILDYLFSNIQSVIITESDNSQDNLQTSYQTLRRRSERLNIRRL
jgi:type III secretory pathway component EscU